MTGLVMYDGSLALAGLFKSAGRDVLPQAARSIRSQEGSEIRVGSAVGLLRHRDRTLRFVAQK